MCKSKHQSPPCDGLSCGSIVRHLGDASHGGHEADGRAGLREEAAGGTARLEAVGVRLAASQGHVAGARGGRACKRWAKHGRRSRCLHDVPRHASATANGNRRDSNVTAEEVPRNQKTPESGTSPRLHQRKAGPIQDSPAGPFHSKIMPPPLRTDLHRAASTRALLASSPRNGPDTWNLQCSSLWGCLAGLEPRREVRIRERIGQRPHNKQTCLSMGQPSIQVSSRVMGNRTSQIHL